MTLSSTRSAPSGRIRWWWVVAAVLLLLVAGVFAFAVFQPIKVLPRIRLAPGFSLTDQSGQPLTSEDLRGKVVLYSFFYTQCGDRCDQINQTMRAVQEQLTAAPLDNLSVQFMSMSFDPDKDTPAALTDYARALGADTSRWHFVTGEADRLKQIIGNGFEAYYAPAAQGGFDFDPTFVLVDGWGIIRGEYHYQVESPDADRLLRHIGVLAEEVRKSQGVKRLVYEAAHLFLCYSP